MSKFFTIILVLLGCGAVLSGCGEQHVWNQKLTVEVSTPDGVISGSSITNMKIVMKAGLQDMWDGGGVFVVGEATSVDLGGGKFLFVLLDGLPERGFNGIEIDQRKTWDNVGPIIVKSSRPIPLDRKNLPMFVTFNDINDPTSVKEVDPNDLAATFGSGYSLKSITLEITDEDITEGEVEKVLGWLTSHKYRLKSPDLRLGSGSHAASDILPEEELRKSNFIRKSK